MGLCRRAKMPGGREAFPIYWAWPGILLGYTPVSLEHDSLSLSFSGATHFHGRANSHSHSLSGAVTQAFLLSHSGKTGQAAGKVKNTTP